MPRVKLLGALARDLGKQLEVEGQRVGELLAELTRRGGPDLARRVYADPAAREGPLHRDLRVLVNGRSIAFLDGIETPLGSGDRVTLHLTGVRGYPGG